DEYSAIADNNVYTNLMAQRNLRLAADAVRRHPDRAAELQVDPEETAAWRDAARRMLIPFDERLGVHPQAEGFTEHQPWDFEHTTRDGLHIASLVGTWIVAVAGFGGMRDHGGALSFAPRLPQRLTRLAFGVSFRGRRLRVEVTQRQAGYSLLQGPPLDLTHHG